MRNKLLSIMLSVTLIMTMTVSMGASVYAETAAESSGAGETAAAERNAGEVIDKTFAVDIPKGLSIISERVGKAVDPIDLSQYVSGGKAPYTYTKLSGPEWVKLSEEGVLSGTRPETEYAAENMTIRVSDSEGASQDIVILADDVLVAGDFIPAGVPNMEFYLTDIDGSKVSTLASDKPKIIFFFNTGCKRCRATVHDIKEFGMNLDEVDFIMSEASNGGVTEAQARKYYDECGIESSARCYDSVDVCWEYLRASGYIEDSTKKPIIVYISKDNKVKGYTWNYTNIYKCAQQALGITLETGEHEWTDVYGTDENGYAKAHRECKVCGLKGTRTIDIPVPEKTSFVYNGKYHSVLENADGYTVVGGRHKNAGDYKTVVYLDDSEGCTWSDGTRGSKVIRWSIAKAAQKPVITTSSKTFKRKNLKKKAAAFTLSVSGSYGKRTFSKLSGSPRLVLNRSTGKVTVRKGTAKGVYRMKVKVSAAATENRTAGVSAAKVITIKVK